jgi:hypothetical protein
MQPVRRARQSHGVVRPQRRGDRFGIMLIFVRGRIVDSSTLQILERRNPDA